MSDPRPYVVCVEGNIASGKTMMLEYFKERSAPAELEILAEPVDLWTNLNGFNLLDMMYQDAARWGLTFQTYVQLTMLDHHVRPSRSAVKLIERSLFSARHCFVENLHRSCIMPDADYHVLCSWFEWICRTQDVHVDLYVYLRTTPETCYQRIQTRTRCEESSVSLSYLRSLHELHEQWLLRDTAGKNVLVLDADKDRGDILAEYELCRPKIVRSATVA